MRKLLRLLLVSAVVAATGWLVAGSAAAATVPFILDGNAGQGLLPGNENPPVPGGTGGILSGISFDTDTNVLTVHIGWGSGHAGQGWTDLSGPALVGHIHGPTPDPAPGGFSQSVGTLYDLHLLPTWNPSASAGGLNTSLAINPADVAALLGNRTYINIHTFANQGGEIRGHLVAVPEPSTLGLVALGLTLVAARRRSR